MTDYLTFWFGADAESVWTEYQIKKAKEDAEAMKRLQEANDE